MTVFGKQLQSRGSITASLLAVTTILLLPRTALGSPYVISDDRIRSLDITPVLGRGYSIATNSFQSTCLVVDETTVPSYNYDYYFTDFTEANSNEVAMQGKVSGSFGYFGIKSEFNTEASSNSKFDKSKHVVTATMRIERYYSSVKEEESDLSRDARQLLTSRDYVGFFKACGPNYVRGIRRAQEVTAIFSFESQSNEGAQAFASKLKVSGWGSSVDSDFSTDSKFKSMSESLSIKILGFGLGLNEQGSDTLVATSLAEFNNVMKFAFQSMTQSENSAHIGMVYGIEVVPWVDNTSFQVSAKIDDQELVVPMPRSLIPKAFPKDAATPVTFTNSAFTNSLGIAVPETRDQFKCKEQGNQIDKFGYCCSDEAMKDDGKLSGPVPVAQAEVKRAEEELALKEDEEEGKRRAVDEAKRVVAAKESAATALTKATTASTAADGALTAADGALTAADGALTAAATPEETAAAQAKKDAAQAKREAAEKKKQAAEKKKQAAQTKDTDADDALVNLSPTLAQRDSEFNTTKSAITTAKKALADKKSLVPDLYSNQICKPTRSLDPSIRKNNMANNGEFVALIDSIVRSRLNVLFTLEKCITSVNALPDRFDYYILKSQDTVKYDATIEATYTIAELKLALDPLKDHSLVTHMGRELDEFIDMYYSPCLAALFGTNIGDNSGTDPKWFMAESWYNHDSCSNLSCLADNMRWDRAKGGCIASVISGSATPFKEDADSEEEDDEHCTKVITDQGDEQCKNSRNDLEGFRANAQHCWDQSARVKSPMYIMDHFCMPQITSDQVSVEEQLKIKAKLDECALGP